jgi:NADPH:quinone reductase-like Zn-dependent oxidoreductase
LTGTVNHAESATVCGSALDPAPPSAQSGRCPRVALTYARRSSQPEGNRLRQ